MKKALKFITGALVLAYAAALICCAKEVGEAVVRSINVCIQTIIPSLFAFMVISGFIISSNLYAVISLPFGAIARYIFRIPDKLFSVFLLSSAAGYPIGAKLLSDLYENGKTDKKTAEEMLGYCYMGGPAFFCGTAGLKLYSSVKIGMIIFICIFAANITIAVIMGFKRKNNAICQSCEPIKVTFRLTDLINSINSGGAALLKICAAIVFFSSFIAILDKTGILTAAAVFFSKLSGLSYEDCTAILRSMLEISNISFIQPDIQLLPIVTALLSFGGLCVIIQVEGVLNGRFLTNIFYLSRIISMILSYIYCKILIYAIDVNKIIQTDCNVQSSLRHNSPIPSLFLLIMTILLLSKNFIVKSKKM